LIVLGLDTATTSTAVALRTSDGLIRELRDDVVAPAHGNHTERVLALAAQLLGEVELGWRELDTVAVGVGPGGYTGLRIGIATARGLSLAADAALVGVGTLRALAEPIVGATAFAILDARRGELFAAAYLDDVEVLAPCVVDPAALADLLPATTSPPLFAVGDGALAQRAVLERAGIELAPEGSELHRVSAAAICRLAAANSTDLAVPLYLRVPDAERSPAPARR
jgi:tRNA threonylcarbamoyladenosine biosynthesis protein TsaB